MMQVRSQKSHRASRDDPEWHQHGLSPHPPRHTDFIHHSHSIQYEIARINQSVTLRRASLVALPSRPYSDVYEIPRLTKTPWERERYKRNSVWKRNPNEASIPRYIFEQLPREIYDAILKQLELLHFSQQQPCPACYLKDLCSLSLTSRAWDRAAAPHMYSKAYVLGDDASCRLARVRVSGTSRLKLLRRTLRNRNPRANMVQEIHMPDFQALYLAASIEREEIVNLVASLVMACPNLGRLVGFHIPFTHSFDRLSHALSTRPKLKERMWVLTDSHLDEDETDEDCSQAYYHAACDPMERFLELNSHHTNLSTLVVHQESSHSAINLTYRAIVGTLKKLPTLHHLSLSGLPASSFPNLALNSLPPSLRSLRLDNLPGVTDRGLQRLSSSPHVLCLRSLALVDLEISRLDVLAGFLSPQAPLLENLSLSQYTAPILHAGPDTPTFLSPTLKRIHWELRSQAGPPLPLFPPVATKDQHAFPFPNDEPIACLATRVLATSIENGFLPALRRIRAPHDPQGILQALCKPLGAALLPSDRSLFTTAPRSASMCQNSENTRAPSPTNSDHSCSESTYSLKQFLDTTPYERNDSMMDSPSFVQSIRHEKDTSSPMVLSPTRSRFAAEARILAARRNPYMAVQIVDPKDAIRMVKTIGGFVGDLNSNIVYDLKPDRNREMVDEHDEDAHEWLTRIDDIMGEWEVAGRYGDCRHTVGGRVGRRAVEVRELFS